MWNKKKTTFFGIVLATALLITPLISQQVNYVENAKATNTYYEKWTSLAEGGTKPYVKTKNGSIIEFNLNNFNPDKPLTDGFYEMQNFEVMSTQTDIGGITKLELELEINGVPYVYSEGDEAPLTMTYMYYIRNEHSGMRESFEADPGFRTIYEWNHGCPSSLMFYSHMDHVKIKSFAITYKCVHENIEYTLNPDDIYMLGGIQGSYADSAHTGYKLDYNKEKNEYHLSLDLLNQDGISTYAHFRHPTSKEFFKINLKESADNYCAVKEGLVTQKNETDLTMSLNSYYEVYLKPASDGSWDVYIKTTAQSLKNWYLVGDGYAYNGTDYDGKSWQENAHAAKFVRNADNYLAYELLNVSLTKDTLLKVRNDTKSLWTNNIDSASTSYVQKTNDGNDNLKVLVTGTYNVKVLCDAGYPYLSFEFVS